MGVYHVYTKMAMVPTYVLYRCQKCHHLIAARGSYGFSSSYTDRGTWTQKGVQRRADAATAELETVAGSMQNSLRKHAMVIYDEDFPNIQCVLHMIDKRQRAGILRETAPLISASKECLMNEAKKNPTYRDADYSAIEKQPDIL